MRRRLRRDGGFADAAALSRGAGQRDLGGQRQRPMPRRDARARRNRRRRSRLVFAEIDVGRAASRRRSTRMSRALKDDLRDANDFEARARDLCDRLALGLQASALIARQRPGSCADAFCRARLESRGAHHYGALPAGVDAAAHRAARGGEVRPVWIEVALNGPWGRARQPGIPDTSKRSSPRASPAPRRAPASSMRTPMTAAARRRFDWQVYARIIEGVRARGRRARLSLDPDGRRPFGRAALRACRGARRARACWSSPSSIPAASISPS